MKKYVCPDEIIALFKSPKTIGEGRRQVVAWTRTLPVEAGDVIMMPGKTAKLEAWAYNPANRQH